ncbi:MAG TPA: hypothetical protein PKM27_04265 [Saprospiraceae bacterium]|nr:hypothetical protein [Saprospiraceae bacterium]HNT20509.1 hypothetical protein [Saprospiraceae bacterium]
MIKQLTIFAFILTICLISCGKTNTESKKTEKLTTIQIDTSVITILPLDTNLHWIFKTGMPTELTTEDLLKIETILKKCVNEYNPEQERQFKEINDKHPEYKLERKSFIIDLARYKRQYMAIVNSKGEKEIWVNCFCGNWDKNSRTSPVMVDDGGNCYFNLKINLTTGQYYELMVNGDA